MGAITSLAFSLRNTNKCVNGHESLRGVVAAEQVVSAADSVAGSTSSVFSGLAEGSSGILQTADNAITGIFDKFGKSEVLDKVVETTGANSKIGAIAQKSVNPLLCAAAATRVIKDDDQYAALIEETAAMGTMFGAEALMKYARSAVTGSTKASGGLAGKVANVLENSSTVSSISEKAANWFKELGNSSHGSAKQFLAAVGIDLLFVAGSICAYNLGHKLGEAISNRGSKENTENTSQA